MEESCKKYTTFVTPKGIYQFKVMPFRLMNTSSKFQQMMDAVLKNIGFVQAYLDVVVVY